MKTNKQGNEREGRDGTDEDRKSKEREGRDGRAPEEPEEQQQDMRQLQALAPRITPRGHTASHTRHVRHDTDTELEARLPGCDNPKLRFPSIPDETRGLKTPAAPGC